MEKGVRTINPMLGEEMPTIKSEESGRFSRENIKLGLIGITSFILTLFLGSALVGRREISVTINTASDTRDSTTRTTFVHLFEWKWTDIEKECVNYLGPNGFSAVQVSPPNEHIDHTLLSQVNPDVGGEFPWWARYQPVSYELESRSGTREEFERMCSVCKSVGVDIYVDLLLNHMARDNVGVGVIGTEFDPIALNYPMYSAQDFHVCDPPGIQGSDYANNPDRVRLCRLVDLPDLNQKSPYVREQLTGFMQDLVDAGVSGFRLDAGKHMYPEDVRAILAGVEGDFYIFSEVIDFGGDAIKATEYTADYDVTEFKYESTLRGTFSNGRLADLYGIGESFGFVPTTSAVVFTDNHDTQRHHGTPMVYRNERLYDLANVFMLAWPYGYPKLMSSYYFEDGEFNKGPPSDPIGNTRDVYNPDGSMNCVEGEWVCEHRRRPMSNMVKFKNFVSNLGHYSVSHWWTNNFQAIGFARSNNEGDVSGYVVVNKEGFSITENFYTGLPDGEYCDVLDGDWGLCGNDCLQCDGRSIVVRGGSFTATVEPMSALAIYKAAMVTLH